MQARSERRLLLSMTLVAAGCSSGPDAHEPQGSEPAQSSEPAVQLSLGTQTGGSGGKEYCGESGAWETVDEPVPSTGVYKGAIQLEAWQWDCELACNAANCLRTCATCTSGCAPECALSPRPRGNVRMAQLEVTDVGSVERYVGIGLDGSLFCTNRRSAQVGVSLRVDETLVANGQVAVSYGTHSDEARSGSDGTFSSSGAVKFEVDANVEVPSVELFRALSPAQESLGKMRGPHPELSVALQGDEALLTLVWECSYCGTSRWNIPLARGVLRREGSDLGSPQESPWPPVLTWQWPEARCSVLAPWVSETRDAGDSVPPDAGAGDAAPQPSGDAEIFAPRDSSVAILPADS